jgi:ATP-dependent DNA helicase RecG
MDDNTNIPEERLYFDDPVERLPDIGPKRKEWLAQLGVETIGDLLFHFPRTYQDRRQITPIAEAEKGTTITVEAEVVSARNVCLPGRMSLAVVTLQDASGRMSATFFGRGFMANTAFRKGVRGLFTGEVAEYKGPSLKNPDYELLSGDDDDRLHTGRIVPIYRLTENVSQRMLRRWIYTALNSIAPITPKQGSPQCPAADNASSPIARIIPIPPSPPLAETLPNSLRAAYGFPPLASAIRQAHFPDEIPHADAARERFAYEELLSIQLGVLGERAARLHEERGYRHAINGPFLKALGRALPFQLTAAQDRAISDLLRDLTSPRPMMRLIQGDVGCGKTIVALHAVAAAADGGFQTALMAPTEILAEQHALHLRALLEPVGLSVELLTGSTPSAAAVRRRIASGAAHVVVGTHALIQEKTAFHRLGLAIIDEQHRFGVLQRQALAAKGGYPDILHMTATPIPRTLAITVYGGMDLTVIDELPPGRLPVKTRRVPPSKIADLYDYIRRQAEAGWQTYIICPLIEESETREDLTPVLGHYEELTHGALHGLRTALLHGRLETAEKDDLMRRFKAREIDVLFSTTVIEVGIDVATATTMIIENASQFGLTQLHQLRGRVGRGAEQSHCFLLGAPRTEDGKRRLEVLCQCNSGFDIAEEDLLLRGPGEFYGVRQAGLSDLRVADLIRDARLLDRARRDAQSLLDADPGLAHAEHHALARAAQRFRRLLA